MDVLSDVAQARTGDNGELYSHETEKAAASIEAAALTQPRPESAWPLGFEIYLSLSENSASMTSSPSSASSPPAAPSESDGSAPSAPS